MSDDNEIWKDIEGFDGKYQISNKCNIRNSKTGYYLKWHKNTRGYHQIILRKNGIKKCLMRNVLMAKAFVPNPYNKPFVDHINTKTEDDSIENLRWVTCKENNRNPLTIQHHRENNYIPEPPKRQVIQYSLNGDIIKQWESITDASKTLGIAGPNIIDVCKGKKYHKTAGGFIWKYAS